MDNENNMTGKKQWYALQVRSRHEKAVFRELERSGFSASLPLIASVRQWSDRKKKIKVPLFRGYVFVEIKLNLHRFNVLEIPGVVRFVGFQGQPVAIPPEQMYWLDLILQQENVTPHLEFPVGSEVTVGNGPLIGLQGTVIKKKTRSRLIVWFDVIMQGLAVEIDEEILKPQPARSRIESGIEIHPQ